MVGKLVGTNGRISIARNNAIFGVSQPFLIRSVPLVGRAKAQTELAKLRTCRMVQQRQGMRCFVGFALLSAGIFRGARSRWEIFDVI